MELKRPSSFEFLLPGSETSGYMGKDVDAFLWQEVFTEKSCGSCKVLEVGEDNM